MTLLDMLLQIVACLIGYCIAMWLWTRVLYPGLLIRDARKRIDRVFGETKRRRRAIHRR